MPHTTETTPSTADALVNEFLRVVMIPDPAAARRFVSPALRIRFTGGRLIRRPVHRRPFR